LLLWLPSTVLSQQKIITIQRIDLTSLPKIQYYFTVTDEAGHSILGLTEDEIEMTINDIPQQISHLKSAIAGGEYLAVSLLFDRSGSMKKAFDQAKEAAIDFIKRMSMDDVISVIGFDDAVRVDSSFTKDRSRTEQAIKNLSLGKDTALYEAIRVALNLLENVTTKRQAIVILSDGKDTKSKIEQQEALSEAIEKSVPLFTIGLGPKIDENNLIKLSSETGGHFFKATTPEQLIILYQTIAEQLQNQYLLSLTFPTDMYEQWHNLKITLKDSTGQQFSAERKYIASEGPGVKPEVMTNFQKRSERKNILLWIKIGAFLGFLLGFILILIIKLIRPEISLLSLPIIGLILSSIILGAILGVLLNAMG